MKRTPRYSWIRSVVAVFVMHTVLLTGCVHTLCGNKWLVSRDRTTSQKLAAAQPQADSSASGGTKASADRLELPTWQRPTAELAPVPAVVQPAVAGLDAISRDSVQRLESTPEVKIVAASDARRENANEVLETSLSAASPIAPIASLLGNEVTTSDASQLPIDLTISQSAAQTPSSNIQLASTSEPIGVMPLETDSKQLGAKLPDTKQLDTETPVASAVATSDVTLELRIENIRPNQGPVKVGVFIDATMFPKREGVWKAVELSDKASVAVAGLSVDRPCAIAVFQDLDGNGDLTKNLLGIPTEPCAFSKGAVIKRAPPKFSEAALTPGSISSPLRTVITLP